MMRILIFMFLLVSTACKSDSSSVVTNRDGHNSEKIIWIEELEKAANNNESFDGNYYSIVTDTALAVFKKTDSIYIAADFTLGRGSVYLENNEINISGDYQAVILPEYPGVWYLKRPFGHFAQALEGMRYPVKGIIKEKNAILNYYDEQKGKQTEYVLKKGTDYFFVVYKDCAVINVWDSVSDQALEGMYCGELYIPQADDHIKINSKYKTKLSDWLGVKE